MAGKRRQLARIGAFVEREEDDREVAFIAVFAEQWAEVRHIIGPHRDVGALVAAEAGEQRRVVVAATAGVDLHHQPIVEAHAGHFGEHLGAEQLRIIG